MADNCNTETHMVVETKQASVARTDTQVTDELPEVTDYGASYLKMGIACGITYQVKLLTWVAWKLMYTSEASGMSKWWLATEARDARGFHDLILKYERTDDSNGKYFYRFVQIKHKTNWSGSKIFVRHLISEEFIDRQYSLIYLFKSYLNMLQRFEHITRDQIVDLTVFTNRNIGKLKFLVPVKKDGIFDFTKGKRYRMNLDMFLDDKSILKCLQDINPDDTLIFDFLNKVVFAVDQPTETELEEFITRDIGKIYGFPQIIYNELYKDISDWFLILEDGKAPYLTEKHMKEHLVKMHNILLEIRTTQIPIINEPLSVSMDQLTDKIKSLFINI